MPEPSNTGEKITFTPEQQAKIDEIIRERMGAAGREAREEAARARAAEQAALEELRAYKAPTIPVEDPPAVVAPGTRRRSV